MRVVPVDGDAVGVDVKAAEGGVGVAQVVHVVAVDGDRPVVPVDVDPDGRHVELGGAVRGQVEAANDHGGAVRDLHEGAGVGRRCQAGPAEDGVLGGVRRDRDAVDSNELHALVVGAGAELDPAAAGEPVDGGLHGGQRRSDRAGRGVRSAGGDDEHGGGGVGRRWEADRRSRSQRRGREYGYA